MALQLAQADLVKAPFKVIPTAATLKGAPVIINTAATDYVVTTTTANDGAVIGVLAEDCVLPPSGATYVMCEVIMFGVAPVRVNAAINQAAVSAGAWLVASTTAGQAAAAAAVAGTNYPSFGKLIEPSAAAGDLVTAFIVPSRPQG